MNPEGPATGHLDTGVLGFPLSLRKYWDGSQVAIASAFHAALPTLSPFSVKASKLFFQIKEFGINEENQNSAALVSSEYF
jgi:hypothetical protein